MGAAPAPNRTLALRRAQTVLAALSVAGFVALFAAANAAAAPGAVSARTATSTTASISVARPARIVAGDILVATVTSRVGAAVTISVPSGWNFVRRDTCLLPGTQMTQALYYRVASSFEPASTSWALSRDASSSAAIAAYRGIDGSAPLMAHGGSAALDSRTATAPSVTTSAPGAMLVGSFGRSSSTSVTAPAGTMPRYAVAGGGSTPVSTFGLDAVQASAGATGPLTTDAAAASGCVIGQLLALRAAAGGGGGGDTTAPSAPGSLRTTGATASSINVAWNASSDNVGVTGYGLYRDGAAAGNTGSTAASFSGLACGRTYTLGVEAYDAAGNRSARSTISASTSACGTPPPPPSGAGTTLTFTDTFWRCTRPVRDYAVNGLPLRVVMRYTGMYVPPTGAGTVQLGAGCVGDGTSATDLVFDIQGDGRTYGPGDDAIRVMNDRPGASNLQIEGRANCGRRVGSAHQDGIQVLGGTNITFRNFEIGNYDAGLATCQGAGGAFFYSLATTNTRVEGGKYIACNHSLFAGSASGHVSGAMFRSGRTDGTDPVCTGYAASEPCMGPQYGSGVTVAALTCQIWNRNLDRWDAG